MHLQQIRFAQIATGIKTIEVRINDAKRQKLAVGDTIKFINNKYPNKTITKTIENVIKYTSLIELFQNIPLSEAGYGVGISSEAAAHDTSQYYNLDEERQFGVVAIFLS